MDQKKMAKNLSPMPWSRVLVFVVLVSLVLWVVASVPASFIAHVLALSYWSVLPLVWIIGFSYLVGELGHRILGWHVPILLGRFGLGMIGVGFLVATLGWFGVFLGIPVTVLRPVSLGLFISLMIYARWNGSRKPRIRHVAHPPLSGLTVVQLSDIHLDGFKSISWLRKVVLTANALEPDIIVITGDILDTAPEHVQKYIPVLRDLSARLGVYVVSGNHDFYSGYAGFESFITACGFVNMDNRITVLEGLQLAGLPDESSGQFGVPSIGLSSLLGRLQSGLPTVLLRHQPVEIRHAATHSDVILKLSGHTHNGQIAPWNWVVKLRYGRYTYGPNHINQMLAYTSNGTSTWGPPFRLFRAPEVVCFR